MSRIQNLRQRRNLNLPITYFNSSLGTPASLSDEVVQSRMCTSCCRGSDGRASDLQSSGHWIESHLGQNFSRLCPLWHTRSVRNYPISVLAERATPIPHSLKLYINKPLGQPDNQEMENAIESHMCKIAWTLGH